MKKTLVVLCFALLIGASLAAQAVTYQITSTPTFVINVGRSEILGNVRFTSQVVAAASTATTIDVLYQGIGCDNAAAASGVRFFSNSAAFNTAPPAGVAISGVVNTGSGCVVSINVPANAVAVGDFIEVQGVRGRVDLSSASAPGVDVNAALNATPSGSALFTAPSIVRVATSAQPRSIVVTSRSYLTCAAPPLLQPRVTVTELFNGAFVQHVVGTTAASPIPTTARTPDGQASANTQVTLIVTGIPAGVTLTWPAFVTTNSADLAAGFGFPDAGVGGVAAAPANDSGAIGTAAAAAAVGTGNSSRLERLGPATATATTQTYSFASVDQGVSDTRIEGFVIIPTVALPATLALGTATIQGNLTPPLITGDATSVTSAVVIATVLRPRFNDPLTNATTLFSVSPCASNLLFPYTVFDAMGGFDTGIAIANTSTDPFGSLGGTATVQQAGQCTLYGYPAAGGTTVVSTVPTAGALASGQTYAASMSTITGFTTGFSGYIIARCNFQYAHAFAYITDGFGRPATGPNGYLALVIPDPLILATARQANNCQGLTLSGCTANTGESLGQ